MLRVGSPQFFNICYKHKGWIILIKKFRYFKNCFWLMLPSIALLLWAADLLPPALQGDVFLHEIPLAISIPENILRFVVFSLPAFMPLNFGYKFRIGWRLYWLGTLLYFGSWAALIIAPQNTWSLSAIGFLAPAYTPLVWLTGVGLIGRRLFWSGLPYRPWMYFVVLLIFMGFHIAHTALVFSAGIITD